jgi:hypothetical protein
MRKAATITLLLLALLLGFTGAAQEIVPEPTPGPTSELSRGHNPGGLLESLSFGVQVGVLGMLVVFSGLVAVYGFMVALGRALGRRAAAAAGEAGAAPAVPISAEVVHAIALALFMDLRTFDEETAEEITIRKITRPFSPWMDSGKTRMILNNQSAYRK